MKSLPVVALFIVLPVVHGQEDPGTFTPPEKPRVAAYSSLWEYSPFTEKEIVVEEQGPGFAENLQLEGVMPLNGEDVAVITDTTTNEVFYVNGSKPTKGITLVEVNNRNSISQLSVVLASGSERSKLGFSDEKLVVGPSAGAAKPANPAAANQQNNNAQQPPPPNAQNQQVTAQTTEKTTLTDEQMRERRRQFWETMRDRRSRGR